MADAGADRRAERSRPAPEPTPHWRRGYDALERQVAPPLEALVRSDAFAQAVGAVAHLQRLARDQLTRSTRRLLHLLNLPTAGDVTRVLQELGRLEQQVRDLRHQIAEGHDDGEHPADRAHPA